MGTKIGKSESHTFDVRQAYPRTTFFEDPPSPDKIASFVILNSVIEKKIIITT